MRGGCSNGADRFICIQSQMHDARLAAKLRSASAIFVATHNVFVHLGSQ